MKKKIFLCLFVWYIGKIILIEFYFICIIRWLSEGSVEYDIWYLDELMFENLMFIGYVM